MAARVQLREITNEEGGRLLRIVRRTSGSVVTWRRAQIVLLSAQGMTSTRISEVVFTDPDTVREVIHNFNRDGFDALYPRYKGGRPATFTLAQRQEIKRIALSDPQDLGQPFSTWSLSKLTDYLVYDLAESGAGGGDLSGRVRPSESAAAPRRQELGAAR